MKTIFKYLIVALVVVTACRSKQEPQTVEANPEGTVETKSDSGRFVIDATMEAEYLVDTYANSLYAVKAAEILKKDAEHEDVKAFAEEIANTNKKIIEELDKLSSAKKISLPSGLTMAQLTDLDKLSAETPRNKEIMFLTQMESEQREGIGLLEKISRESEDNEISTVAIACLSQMKMRYDEVVQVKEKLSM